jgi:hypothetical protein
MIYLDDEEFKILNTVPMQRLRRIRQLAMTYHSYPGAMHTRFEHSIGTCHVAGRIFDHLKNCYHDDVEFERVRKIVRFAALLHDVGHPPFSHAGELVLRNFTSKKEGKDINDVHEKVSAAIIREDASIREILDRQVGFGSEEVASVIEKKAATGIARSIISGQVDSDKLDYLLRDSHFTGVKYGIYDLERIINTVTRYRNKADDRLAFNEEGLQAVEQLVLARHHMMSQVYMHKTRLITDRMIERGLGLAIKDGIIEQRYFEYAPIGGFVELYLSLDDQLLSDRIISDEKKSNASVLFRRLRERKLLKNSFEVVLDIEQLGSIGIRDDPVINRLSRIESEDAAWIEGRVAEKLKDLDRELIILDVIEQKTPSSSKGAFMNPDDILFMTQENEARTFKRLTNSVFSSKLFEPPTTKIALYLPIDDKRRDELKETLKRGIMPEILRNLYESDSEAQHKLT